VTVVSPLPIPVARRGSAPAALAWSLAAACAVLAVLAGALHQRNAGVPSGGYTAWWLPNAAGAVALGAIGGLVAARRPRSPIGWILLAEAVGHGLTGAAREWAVHRIAVGPAGAGRWPLWLSNWAWMIDLPALTLMLLLFPDGRLRSRRWSVPLAAGLAASLAAIAGTLLAPGSMLPPGAPSVPNPVGWPWAMALLERVGESPILAVLWTALGLGVISMALHARGATGETRVRTSLVAAAGLLTVLELVSEYYLSYPGQPIAAAAVMVGLAGALAVAILRYRLYDLDPVLNRTLVFGGLTLALGGAYVAIVVLASAALDTGGVVGSIPAAVAVTLLFAPLRARLQRAVDRLLYGERRDPYAVIASVGERLDAPEAADVLPALAETVARTLKLPYVAIELDDGERLELGTLRGEPLRIPLVQGGAALGQLTLGRRTATDAFTRPERRLFEDIARQVAVAARAVRLTADLQRSRERLVSAREEERRRVRRDLHDGLGPTLAGFGLQLESARTLLARDAGAADALLARLGDETRAAIADVRRLVYDLRPPALDDLGLVPALEQQAQRFPGLEVAVLAPRPIERLPAAVEVAAYRIATEALTNVARHAAAQRCTIHLRLNGCLELEVRDDGRGMPGEWRPGVGVASIRERAAELGGTCTLEAVAGGGTRVLARLPLRLG
jgi:two-component system NarL family sensor kinase